MKPKPCAATKPDGTPCGGFAVNGSERCFAHAQPDAWADANQRGGQAVKKNQNPLPALTLQQPKDVVALLAETINGVRSGALDLRVANCIGYLAGHLTRAMETAELDDRVKTIESILVGRKAYAKRP
jgi:hypothetical protein